MMGDSKVRAILEEFEAAWRRRRPLTIESVLSHHRVDLSERRPLVIELAAIEIEFRQRDGEIVRTEEYLARFPELADDREAIVELVSEEFRGRLRREVLEIREFQERFPLVSAEIEERLLSIETELQIERAAFHPPENLMQDSSQLLFEDEFTLMEMIGSGGAGKVYRAQCHPAGEEFAVKFLRRSFLNDHPAVRRFLAEAKTIRDLSHPGIVSFRGVGMTTRGHCYFAMELVNGPDLRDFLKNERNPALRVVDWMIEAADALAGAHRQGVVHCDLKPGNLLIDPQGAIKVTDFGFAREMGNCTMPMNAIAGTVPFMAPEQIDENWGSIGPWTDIYGLGATMFTLLCGSVLYPGRSVWETINAVVSSSELPIRELLGEYPAVVQEFCETCLRKKPRNRFSTMEEVINSAQHVRVEIAGR